MSPSIFQISKLQSRQDIIGSRHLHFFSTFYLITLIFSFLGGHIPTLHAQTETEESAPALGPVLLDPVVVTGSREEQKLSDTAATIEVISKKRIKESGAENVADILEEHTGVQITRSFRGSGIQLQGFDSKHILILVYFQFQYNNFYLSLLIV